MKLIFQMRHYVGTGFLGLAVICTSQLVQAAGTTSTVWLLSYQGKSTNQLVWDDRIRSLVQTRIPAKLSAKLAASLGGPPDPVWITSNRFVSFSACVPHDCGDKGFMWIDTQTGIGLGAYASGSVISLASNGMSSDHIPDMARRSLIAWIGDRDLAPAAVEFIGRDGTSIALDKSAFQPPEKFHPPSSGPSFNCNGTVTRVEDAICKHGELSKLDLDLAALVTKMRRQSSTSNELAQLQDLQRQWEKDRDGDCAATEDIRACVKQKYETQYLRLMNWIPTKQ